MSDYGGVSSNGVGAGVKNDAFADAVQRARQIAAKIGGEPAPSVTNNGGAESYPFTGQKRSLEEGDEPDAKKMASQSERDSAMSIGAQLAALSQQSVRPSTITEEYKVPDSMVGLIIGRGGEQINKIQHDSGCKVQIAHGELHGVGLPERSISLTGSPEAIQRAKAFLDDIVSRGHESSNGQSGSMQEIIIPAGKAGLIIGKGGETIKQLQERAGVKMILVQDGSQPPNIDKPLRIIGDPYKVQQAKEMVNEILRERDHSGFGDRNEYGSRMGGGGIDIAVPRQSVGVVIGRSGEMIKKIQSDAGVKIQFKPDDGTGPEKIAHITGPPDQCQHAASIITDLLQSIRAREEGGQGGPPGPGMPPGGRGRGGGQGSWGPPGEEMTFTIPAHKCGLVIGRGGENIKSINQQTGAFVEISRQMPPNGDPNYKLFIIRGSPQQIDHAKQLIEEKIEEHYLFLDAFFVFFSLSDKSAADPNAAWAAYYAQYYGQQPAGAMAAQAPGAPAAAGDQGQAAQTSGGQPDYTKAWEEYYKKMGMSKKLPPRVCVPLKNIVSEEFLRAGHIFLGFTKCGRYVLSYTSDCGEDDDFSFYTYHLYWWEFNLHSRLKQVIGFFCSLFLLSTRSSSSVLMNLMMSDENNRDIYITIASMPPPQRCSKCCPVPSASTIRTEKQGQSSQILYTKGAAQSTQTASLSSASLDASSLPQESPENRHFPCRPPPIPSSPSHSQAAMRAREFAADLFRRAQGGGGGAGMESEHQGERRTADGDEKEAVHKPEDKGINVDTSRVEEGCKDRKAEDRRTSSQQASSSCGSPNFGMSPASSPSSLPSTSALSSCQNPAPSEPGYVNYSRLHYRLQQQGAEEQNPGGAGGES
ncbi:hypothetical protein XENOCAPTIV_024564 [Xenoophorus captivus]|uniref:K Homology domain-containing protein n=1 Tax=Xenoophorus captivus TaxID=1517983 RepID=A0ABV0SB80_9TELE